MAASPLVPRPGVALIRAVPLLGSRPPHVYITQADRTLSMLEKMQPLLVAMDQQLRTAATGAAPARLSSGGARLPRGSLGRMASGAPADAAGGTQLLATDERDSVDAFWNFAIGTMEAPGSLPVSSADDAPATVPPAPPAESQDAAPVSAAA